MPTVLVVDDERLIRDLLQRILVSHGYDVVTGGSGSEALELFQRYRPQITLLDLNMPGMNGITALKRLRGLSPMNLTRAIRP